MSDGTILFAITEEPTGESWSLIEDDEGLSLCHICCEDGPMASIPLPPLVLARLLAPASTPIVDRRQRVIPFRRVA